MRRARGFIKMGMWIRRGLAVLGVNFRSGRVFVLVVSCVGGWVTGNRRPIHDDESS